MKRKKKSKTKKSIFILYQRTHDDQRSIARATRDVYKKKGPNEGKKQISQFN
jgi:hypothetical protein